MIESGTSSIPKKNCVKTRVEKKVFSFALTNGNSANDLVSHDGILVEVAFSIASSSSGSGFSIGK